MDRLNMYIKSTFKRCLVVTNLTVIFNSFMDRFHMYPKFFISEFHCIHKSYNNI